MGPGQLGTWDKVSPPSMKTEGMQSDKTTGNGFAGASYVSSKETPDRPEQAGGMRSAQTTQTMGKGGVGKSTLTSPSSSMGMMPRDGGKY